MRPDQTGKNGSFRRPSKVGFRKACTCSKRVKGALAALFVFVAFVVSARVAAASTVSVACARLASDADEELEARAQVLFYVYRTLQATFIVECDATAAWVQVVGGPRLIVDEQPGLVEGILVAMERYLQDAAKAADVSLEVEDETQDRSAVGADGAAFDPEAELEPSGTPDATISKPHVTQPGGVGLSLAAEVWSSPTVLALGPRLDIGVGAGDVCGLLIESLRLASVDNKSISVFEVQFGVNWGAPYAPTRPFGLAVLLGLEFLAGSRAGHLEASRTSRAFTLAVGGRYGKSLGPILAWLGADLRLRTQKNVLGEPFDVELPLYGAMLLAGGLLSVDGGVPGG